MSKPTYEELEQNIQSLQSELASARRKEREKAISELKWQWQTTFDAVGASICVLDVDWHILQCNRATADLFQKMPDQLIGSKCFEIIHGASQPLENCPVRRILKTKQREVEVLAHGDRWIEVAVDPILDHDGNILGIVHIVNDITEQCAALESIQKAQNTLKSIFKAAPTGIGMVVNNVMIQANDRLCTMTRYSLNELIGQNTRILYLSDDEYEFVGEYSYAQISQRGTGTIETRWQQKGGGIIDVLLSSTPLNANDLSEGVTFTALDITQRKQIEKQLAQIFNMSLDMLCIADIKTATFIKVNPAFQEILGYPQQELLGRSFIDFIHPEDVQATQKVMQVNLGKGLRVINFENRYRCKDGNYRWLNWVSHPDREQGVTYAVAHDITIRKKFEAELQAAAQVVQEIPSGLFVYDYYPPDRLILYHGNPAAERLTGIKIKEWIGKEFNALWPEAHQSGITEAFLNVMRTGKPYYTEDLNYQDHRLQGAFRISAFAMSETRLCVAFEDITQHKQSERSLLFFKSAVENSADAIGMSTPEGKHWYQNKAFDDLFGQIGEDAVASVYIDKEIGHQVFQTMLTGALWSGEVEMRGKGNRIKHILLRAYAVKDEQDNIASLVGVHTDITDRKRFEHELRRSESRFRALAELLPQTVFEMSMDGRLTFVNNNALLVFGYSREDFEKGLYAIDMIAPEDRQSAQAMLQAILRDNADFEGRKYSAIKKDGTIFPVLIYSTLNTDGGGETGLRGIIIDISEQEKLAQEKVKLEEQYNQAQKMDAVGRLAGGVAHDLNNMLSPIVGYGELLLDAMPDGSPNRHAIEQIFSAGQRAKDMVRQLLAFSRKQALKIKSINIYEVLAGFEKLLDRILRDDVKLELKLSRGIPNILADPGQMEQVVMNLAINAQDAMPDGGKITIEVGTVLLEQEDVDLYAVASPGLYVVLTFSDTGHGMTLDIQERIFDPFFTTKGQGKGTGLGLATVYGIIKQHNGSIRVYSEPGTGTVFNIYFPAALSEPEQREEYAEERVDLKGTETILVVEDNDAVRGLAENILKKNGYQTTSVNGGKECMALLANKPYLDMLLTDVVLQDTNGKELFHKVKVLYPDIKVLYMSGYTDDVIVHHGVLEEGISFIQKPFSVQRLLRKVRQVLDDG